MTAKRPLAVLLLNYEFPPMGGGAGHASSQLARTLVTRGCAVDVITSSIPGQPAFERIEGVRVFRVRSLRRSVQECGFLGAWSFVMGAQPLFRRLLARQRYDVVHYFFGLPTGVLSLLTPGARRVPAIISLRGSDVPGYDPFNRTLQAVHRILLPLTRRIWSEADAVIALSRSLHAQASAVLPHKSIDVISNGVESSVFTPSTSQNEHRNHIELLSVARLIPRKGLDDLLQATTLLQDLNMHLTIQGRGSHAESFQALAMRMGVIDRVTFAGFLARPLLPRVYQQADIFVLPSLAESCGLALLEAMSCGLPVVVTRVGGMVEHVEDGVNGFIVPPRDPAALAHALRRLIEQPALRRRMGQANTAKIRQQYTWDAVADAYLARYHEVRAHHKVNGVSHATA